jgi:thymidylate kinase
MRVYFEGLDLAGKSTVCRLFREHVRGNWQVRRNTLLPVNPIYDLADRFRKDRENEEIVGWLYYAALLLDLERYQPSQEDVIQDSTILLRSIVFHKARGTPILADCLERLIDRHPRFDHSFVLVADHKTRMDRLAKRRPQNLGPEDFLVRDDPERFYAMERQLVEYATRHFDAVVLDTSGELDVSWLDNVFRHIPNLLRNQAGA